IAALGRGGRAGLPCMPRSGIATNPLITGRAMAPSVLTEYAVPTLLPTTAGPRATILLTSGNAAPMASVGGRMTTNVLVNVSQSGVPQYAFVKPSHQTSSP